MNDKLVEVEFWLGGDKKFVHRVKQVDIDRCLAAPTSMDRFQYWQKVTGNRELVGNVMVWSPVRRV